MALYKALKHVDGTYGIQLKFTIFHTDVPQLLPMDVDEQAVFEYYKKFTSVDILSWKFITVKVEEWNIT